MTMDSTLDVYYEFVMGLTREAAKVITNSIKLRKTVDTKRGDWDLVTQYDREIEEIIIDRLKSQYPDHMFIAEESAGNNSPDLTDAPTWIIDPIDGTTNFVHGFPHTCVVIALAIRKEVVIGIVYNPLLEQLFTARKGRGAFLNGEPISTSEVDDFSKALVCFEPGFIKIESMAEYVVERLRAIIKVAHGIRTLGVAALTLCYVAMGAVDAYHIEGPGIEVWDIAAASLIIAEAGGVVVDRVSGERVDIMKPRAIGAANSKIADAMVKIIRETDERVDQMKNSTH
ncbi:inositol monophosphatase 2-like isoform X1 [Neodiprion lecontei]|uniref:Inositol-1-monophosphatase n=1 Tax=Neodiprion lecontei TaxID=441921 RepID=A0A6J0BFW6_NEOLC|nr:inositol monophosphatase 2-like isoform X1 [Neodiprion lecontei]